MKKILFGNKFKDIPCVNSDYEHDSQQTTLLIAIICMTTIFQNQSFYLYLPGKPHSSYSGDTRQPRNPAYGAALTAHSSSQHMNIRSSLSLQCGAVSRKELKVWCTYYFSFQSILQPQNIIGYDIPKFIYIFKIMFSTTMERVGF